MSKRSAPYKHHDGSGCWTKECSLGNTSLERHLNANPLSTPPTKMMGYSHVAKAHVPRELDEAHAAYYEATDKKHFGDKTEPGSKFLNPELKKIEDALILRMRQTGQRNLDGDDREALIARGSDSTGFMESKRYLMVLTEGSVGIKHSAELADNATLYVIRTKPGAPCSLVMGVEEQEKTDFAVIVLGQHQTTGKDFLLTTFPGPVTKPTVNKDLDALEGQSITVGTARTLLKGNFWINTRLN